MSQERSHQAAGCPDSVRLAEFVDGRLEGGELDDLLRHLDRCEDCRDVVAASAELVEHLEPGGVRRLDRRGLGTKGWLRLALAAALVVMGVAVAWRLDLVSGSSSLAVAELTQGLGSPDGAWSEHGWAVTRGDGASEVERNRAFRSGVRVVDLELALRLGDFERARVVLAALADTLEGRDGSEAAAFLYRQLAERVETDRARSGKGTELFELSANGDELLAELFSTSDYRLGKWAEAGRLSALSNSQLLDRRAFRRELERLLAEDLRAADRVLLEEVERRLPAASSAEAFTRLIDSR